MPVMMLHVGVCPGHSFFHQKMPRPDHVPTNLLQPASEQRNCSLVQMATVGYKKLLSGMTAQYSGGISNGERRLSMNSSGTNGSSLSLTNEYPMNYFTDHDSEGSILLPQHKHVRMWPLLFRRFKYVSLLGQGRFSKVVLCEDSFISGRKVAIKVMNEKYNDIGIQESMNYYKMQQYASSKSISTLLSTFFFYGHFCLVFELLGENLLLYIQRFQPYTMKMDIVKKLALQLLSGLAYMRDHNVIHADLKPENILMGINSKSSLKISDFGNSIDFSDKSHVESNKGYQIQTLYYRSPEVLLNLSSGFNFQIDVWSVGCILMESYTGNPVFNANTPEELYKQMVTLLGPPPSIYYSSKLYRQYESNRSDRSNNSECFTFHKKHLKITKHLKLSPSNYQFASLLTELLEYDPNKRITPQKALLHPFLSSLFPFSTIANNTSGNNSDAVNDLKVENLQQKQTIENLQIQNQKLREEIQKLSQVNAPSPQQFLVTPTTSFGQPFQHPATPTAPSFSNQPQTSPFSFTPFISPVDTSRTTSAHSNNSSPRAFPPHTHQPPPKKVKLTAADEQVQPHALHSFHNTRGIASSSAQRGRLSCEKCTSIFVEFSELDQSSYVVKCKKCKHVFIKNRK